MRDRVGPRHAIACSWATASKPPATVSATSSARLPSPVNQTPLRFAGDVAGKRSKMRRSSPVGSRGKHAAQRAGRLRGELGERRFERRAQRRGAEALAAAAGAEHVAVVHERLAVGAQPFVAAVLHRGEQAARAQLRRHGAARFARGARRPRRRPRPAGGARRRRCASARAGAAARASPTAAGRRRGRRPRGCARAASRSARGPAARCATASRGRLLPIMQDGHHRAVAAALEHLDALQPGARARERDRLDVSAQLRLARREPQLPRAARAGELRRDSGARAAARSPASVARTLSTSARSAGCSRSETDALLALRPVDQAERLAVDASAARRTATRRASPGDAGRS